MSALATVASPGSEEDYSLPTKGPAKQTQETTFLSSLEQEIVTRVKQRRSSSVFGSVATLEEINREAEEEAAEIMNENGSFDQKTAILHGIFSKFATWELNANACFISRTKFRKFCIDANIVGPGKVLVGDIEVVFYECLQQPARKARTIWKREDRFGVREAAPAPSRKKLLSYSQFVAGLGLLAMRMYGAKRYEHLDPRLCSRVVRVDDSFTAFYQSVLLPYAAKRGLLNEAEMDLKISEKEKEFLHTALPLVEVERNAFKEIFKFYSTKEASAHNGVDTDGKRTLSFNEVHAFCRDFEVVSRAASISQCLRAFRQVRNCNEINMEDVTVAELNFEEFLLFNALIAVRYMNVFDANGSYNLHPSARKLVMGYLKRLDKSDGCKIMARTLRNGRHVRFVNKSTQFK